MDEAQLDLATAIARIEQIGSLPEGDGLRESIIDRLVTCDAPRLRKYLTEDALEALDRVQR